MQLKKPIFGHFLPKFPSIRFFPEKSFELISNLDASVTSRKIHWFCVYFGPLYNTATLYKKFDPFWPFLTQLPQNKIFPKTIIQVHLQVLCCCDFMQKSEKFHKLIFHKTWKTSFWVHFGLFWSNKPRTKCFSKKSVFDIFKVK